MSNDQKESTSKNSINQYADDNDLKYKAYNNSLENLFFTEYDGGTENINELTSEGNETLLKIIDTKYLIKISDVLEPKKIIKNLYNI